MGTKNATVHVAHLRSPAGRLTRRYTVAEGTVHPGTWVASWTTAKYHGGAMLGCGYPTAATAQAVCEAHAGHELAWITTRYDMGPV